MVETGNNLLTVTVYKFPENALDDSALVAAIVTKPDSSTDSIIFSSQGNGEYQNNYNFDANGAYKFNVSASHDGYTDGNVESYVYVGDVNLFISFLNNNQSTAQGHTSSIINKVENQDGNAFTGIDGNITISYPDSIIWINNEAMAEDSGGEYYYNFIAQTTLGEYGVTSTFNCGNSTDSNSQGRFTVTTSCGNGTCDAWESCSSCLADCGSCPTEDGGPSGSQGGGGGGPGPQLEPKEPEIIRWWFDTAPEVAVPSLLRVEIANHHEERDFLLVVKISQAQVVGYEETQVIENVKANEVKTIVMDKEYISGIAGTQVIEIQLLSKDDETEFDAVIETFDIPGIVRYDVIVDCLDRLAKVGGTAKASITALNLGDFYKDVQLSWWVESSAGALLEESSVAIALYSNESKQFEKSVEIPFITEPGMYWFIAEVDYKGEKTQSSCSFMVEEDKEYYKKIFDIREEALEQLAEEITQKQEDGFPIFDAEDKIRRGRYLISLGRIKHEGSDFDGLDSIVAELDVIIKELEDIKKKGKPSYLTILLGSNLLLILLGLILLIIVVVLFYRLRKSWDKILGLEEPKSLKDEKGIRWIDKLFWLR